MGTERNASNLSSGNWLNMRKRRLRRLPVGGNPTGDPLAQRNAQLAHRLRVRQLRNPQDQVLAVQHVRQVDQAQVDSDEVIEEFDDLVQHPVQRVGLGKPAAGAVQEFGVGVTAPRSRLTRPPANARRHSPHGNEFLGC